MTLAEHRGNLRSGACEQVAGEHDGGAVGEGGTGGHEQIALRLDTAELGRLDEAIEADLRC